MRRDIHIRFLVKKLLRNRRQPLQQHRQMEVYRTVILIVIMLISHVLYFSPLCTDVQPEWTE